MTEEQYAEQRERALAQGVRLRQGVIGQKLRTLFDGVVDEPIPDDFRDLLRQLDERGSEAI